MTLINLPCASYCTMRMLSVEGLLIGSVDWTWKVKCGWVDGRAMLLQYAKSLSPAKKHGVVRPGIARVCLISCAALLNCCAMLLIVRSLGPAAFGRYALVRWLATVAAPAIGVGMSALTRCSLSEISSRESPRLAAGICYFMWRRHYRKILLYCLVYLLLVIPFAKFFGGNAPGFLLLVAGLAIPPCLLSRVASITLRSLRRSDLLVAIQLAGAMVLLLLVIATPDAQLPQRGSSVAARGASHPGTGQALGAAFLLASAAASLVILILALLCIPRLLPLRDALTPGTLLKQRLTRGLHNSLLLFTLDGIVWQPSELLLLGHWRSAADLGCYALSFMLSSGFMNIAPTLLFTCLLPLLLRAMPGQHYMNGTEAWIKLTLYTALLTLPMCVIALLCCPALIVLCFGTSFLPVVTPLRILLISAAFGSVATASTTRLANGNRKQAQLWPGAAAAILNVALALPCIALWGVSGAAFASASAQVLYATCTILLCGRDMLGRRR